MFSPEEEGYLESRRVFNGLIERRPVCVARPLDSRDVARAVAFAGAEGLPVSIRGGGHAVAGHGVGDGALALDLRLLSQVLVDPQAGLAKVQGGAVWRTVDEATHAHGLAVTGGTFDLTGVGGLTLTGGFGYLMGACGLTVDNLVAAEVVTAAGEILSVDAKEHPDLFWALRGGGGNFGVVTEFTFQLHPVKDVFGGMLLYPLEQGEQAFRLFRDLLAEGPDELTLLVNIGTVMDAPALVVSVCHLGREEQARADLEPLLRLCDKDMTGVIPYLQLQQMTQGMPSGLRHYWKGGFLSELPDDLIDHALAQMRQRGPGISQLLFEPLHGQAARGSDDMAFNRQGVKFNASALAIWQDPAEDVAEIEWARAFAARLTDHSAHGASYLNYGSEPAPEDKLAAVFGKQGLKRLKEVKRCYDPENLFRFNHNILP